MKSAVLLLSLIVFIFSLHGLPEDTAQEMATFYDPKVHGRTINIYFLDSPYNARTLRKIIVHTEQHGTPPEHTLELFKHFMTVGYNYIAFEPFLQKHTRTLMGESSHTETVLLQYAHLARLLRSESVLQQELRNMRHSRRQLEASMGIETNHH